MATKADLLAAADKAGIEGLSKNDTNAVIEQALTDAGVDPDSVGSSAEPETSGYNAVASEFDGEVTKRYAEFPDGRRVLVQAGDDKIPVPAGATLVD